jgi:hypothetical protein
MRPLFTGLTFRELLAFLVAPAAVAIVVGLVPMMAGEPSAALSVIMLYWIVFVSMPTWAVGTRLYVSAKKRSVVGLKTCIAGGAIAKALVIFGFGVIASLFLTAFYYPVHEVFPRWLHWIVILAPWGCGASALGAVEGLLFWMFIHYWPPLRSERRPGV